MNTTTTDLFENMDSLPPKVYAIVEEMNEIDTIRGGMDYSDLSYFNNELNKIGYSFEFYLDCVPFNLRKIKA